MKAYPLIIALSLGLAAVPASAAPEAAAPESAAASTESAPAGGGMGGMKGHHGRMRHGGKGGHRGGGKHGGFHDEVRARLDRIEKRQVLIETMLRQLLLER